MKSQFIQFGRLLAGVILVGTTLSCVSRPMQSDREEDLLRFDDYDEMIQVEEIKEPVVTEDVPKASAKDVSAPREKATKTTKTTRATKAAKAKDVDPPPPAATPPARSALSRQPGTEDSEGFLGHRRPLHDPFRVGEKVSLAVSYFRVVAGVLELEVLPFVQVNGEKAYHFRLTAKSNNFFNRIYSVDDMAETYVNYEKLRPYNMSMSIRESRQMKEVRSVHDWERNIVTFRERGFDRSGNERNRDFEWELLPYAQNVLSGTFYMRNFNLIPGKTIQYDVADRGKNIVVQIEVLRREKLKTDLGEFDTVVVQPRFEIDGVFRATGDIFLWLTDDDRKLIVHFASELKIGTLVGKLVGLERGRD